MSQTGHLDFTFSVTNGEIRCLTPVSRDPQVALVTVVLADGRLVTAEQTYEYRPDPTIRRLDPVRTIASGGIQITVEGTSLTSVNSHTFTLSTRGQGRRTFVFTAVRPTLYIQHCHVDVSCT